MSNIPKDPVILLSFINTQLRDHFSSLDTLCSAYMVEKNAILEKLDAIDYSYDAHQNQFV